MNRIICFAVLSVAIGGLAASAQEIGPVGSPRSVRRLPGLQAAGETLLVNQWSLRPAGKQVPLGDFPVNIALHPTEPWAAVLHAGYGEHEVAIVDLKEKEPRVISRASVPQAFYGLCFGPKGNRLFVSGAEHEVVHVFQFNEGYLGPRHEIKIGEPKERLVPAGLSLDAEGKFLFGALPWGDAVFVASFDEPPTLKRIAFENGSYPYTTLPSRDGQRLFVSLWGGKGVAVVNLASLQVEKIWPTQPHPTEMLFSPDEELLYVACANSNTVCVLETKTGRTIETIASSLYPQASLGSTPNSLALSADGRVLFIANADNNNLAVIDVSERGRGRSLGFIPVGWYPTSVRFNPRDNRLYVANGKGLTPKANRQGPNPINNPAKSVQEYIAGLFRGSLSVIESPSPVDMAKHTRVAMQCSPLLKDESTVAKPRDPHNPVPAKVGDDSPIKHCIYIIKENRTYDQVFGDLPQGNGDANLCIFPEKVTPNHHALAREFVLLDNFYVEGEVSADGHEWSMAAYATDYVEKTWPLVYRGGKGKLKYPSEGGQPIAFPAAGYIWDRCREAGVSYRSYGEFVKNGLTPNDPGTALMPALVDHFDPHFRSFDMDYSDLKRAARFVEELKRFEEEGELPEFIVLRLPNDHTNGTTRGKLTPTAFVAQNDLALGQLVEAVSQSKFWKDTAIFVVEDDAQNGSDHVDAHRTVAMVISPYTKRGHVDSNMYSTSSMLRTMELILGLKPMSQFDAAALPMYDSFQAEPNLTPFKHRSANVDLEAKNTALAWGGKLSEKLDFTKEDAADDLLLNEIVWRSVRGPNSPMPAPVRAAFVFTLPEKDEDD